MLTKDVQSYLAVRRGMGFALHSEGTLLESFATLSPTLRTGRFKATDKLIDLLKAAVIMRSEKPAR
jgi:hypothetical protein